MMLNQVVVLGIEVLSVPPLSIKTPSGRYGYVKSKEKDEEGVKFSSPPPTRT